MGKKRSTKSFNGSQFKALFDKMLEKFKGEIDYSDIEKNRTEIVGKTLPADKNTGKTLIDSVLYDKNVIKVIEEFFSDQYNKSNDKNQISITFYSTIKKESNNLLVNPEYLYKEYGTFLEKNGKPKKNVRKSLQSPYPEIFCAYVGIEDIDAFLKENNSESSIEDNEEESVLEKKEVKFEAFYYSYHDYRVKSFDLDIMLSSSGYSIRMGSFHDDPMNYHIYSGNVEIINRKLQGSLSKVGSSVKEKVYIILKSGQNPLGSKEILGSLMTVSAREEAAIINIEFYLIKKNLFLKESIELKSINRYLLMHRYNFRIPTTSRKSINLTARGTDVDYIEHLVGTFRVWRFDSKYKSIVQSVLWIKEDYRISCFTNFYKKKKYNNQNCLLHQNIFNKEVLSMSSHPYDGTGVLGYMMINLIPEDANGDLFSGSFVSSSDLEKNIPINRAIVLKREIFEKIKNNESSESIEEDEMLLTSDLNAIPMSEIDKVKQKYVKLKELLLRLEREDRYPLES